MAGCPDREHAASSDPSSGTYISSDAPARERNLCTLAPLRAEPVSAAPVPLSLKSKWTQRRAEFARMTIAAPMAARSRVNAFACSSLLTLQEGRRLLAWRSCPPRRAKQ